MVAFISRPALIERETTNTNSRPVAIPNNKSSYPKDGDYVGLNIGLGRKSPLG